MKKPNDLSRLAISAEGLLILTAEKIFEILGFEEHQGDILYRVKG